MLDVSETEVISNRSGSVLSQNTILKIDVLPKQSISSKKSSQIPFSGTKNFRKVEGFGNFQII
jgi:hypothetical protein